MVHAINQAIFDMMAMSYAQAGPNVAEQRLELPTADPFHQFFCLPWLCSPSRLIDIYG